MSGLHTRFGAVVRHRRKALGWSQQAFADRAGLSRSYSGEVERGVAIPSLATTLKIAAALGVPLSDLVAEAEGAESADPSRAERASPAAGGVQP